MDTAVKRRAAEQVRRLLTQRLLPFGFARGKTSFWVRPRDHVIEFLHLHLYKFPAFRVHAGIRVLNDTFEAPHLNGPTSQEYWSGGQPTYRLDFADTRESLELCAAEIARFCTEISEPWFERYREPRALLAAESPLTEGERSRLDRAVRGLNDVQAVELSRQLLGVTASQRGVHRS